jgi:hypothetical protein
MPQERDEDKTTELKDEELNRVDGGTLNGRASGDDSDGKRARSDAQEEVKEL